MAIEGGEYITSEKRRVRCGKLKNVGPERRMSSTRRRPIRGADSRRPGRGPPRNPWPRRRRVTGRRPRVRRRRRKIPRSSFRLGANSYAPRAPSSRRQRHALRTFRHINRRTYRCVIVIYNKLYTISRVYT